MTAPKTAEEWAAYAEALERCIAAQTERETDLRWQLSNLAGQLKEARHQAAFYCHMAMQMEQRYQTGQVHEITLSPAGIQTSGGGHE